MVCIEAGFAGIGTESIRREGNIYVYFKNRRIIESISSGRCGCKSAAGLQLFRGEGRVWAVVGASGSGKSTLLNLCGGLDRPTGGKVFIGEEELCKNSDEKLAEIRRRKIGFIFQNNQLIPIMTAYENLVI